MSLLKSLARVLGLAIAVGALAAPVACADLSGLADGGSDGSPVGPEAGLEAAIEAAPRDATTTDASAKPTFTVGGTVSGLVAGEAVVLENAGAPLTVNGDGAFAFPSLVPTGSPYDVTVVTQPSNPTSQTCAVGAGTGVVGDANVTNVTVTCTVDAFTIGGSVTGLAAGDSITLSNNGGPGLVVSADGPFVFPTPVASGGSYVVTLVAQPSGSTPETCAVASASGVVGQASVTSVVVTCASTSFTLGGTLTGLAGGDVVLANGAATLALSGNGPFTLPVSVPMGASYDVTVATQPSAPPQSCTIANGSGTANADVSNILVTCVTGITCTKAFTSYVADVNPYSTAVTVTSWAMVGGGGGGGGMAEGGGGGGSSAILNGSTLIAYAAGGDGGAPEADGGSTGQSGVAVLSSMAMPGFTLPASGMMTVIVGGGGGGGNDQEAGGQDTGAGGGAGYFGGGGAGNAGYGGGGSNVGGNGNVGGESVGFAGTAGQGGGGGAQIGLDLAAYAAHGGDGSMGGAAGYGGGGGGYGGGGGGGYYGPSGNGGSSGADGTTVVFAGAGGLGANHWSTATTLPSAAGQGGTYGTNGAQGGTGGNAGLVILTYLSPTATCAL